MRRVILGAFLSLLAVALLATLATTMFTSFPSAPSASAQVPEGQTYTGAKRCSSCHFEQFMTWKKLKHPESFNNLPAKYKTNEECLKCHTTGYGEPTGFKTAADTGLAGVTCEACHGPGSKHEEVCQAYKNKKELTDQEKALCEGSIHKMLPNVCMSCHKVIGHGKHPEFDKE
ncbi:MAG: cytochrome c family protein [Thermoguttaceae bacterium]